MNGKPCASPGIATCWEAIDWQKALAYVKKLQVRIVKAQKEGHYPYRQGERRRGPAGRLQGDQEHRSRADWQLPGLCYVGAV